MKSRIAGTTIGLIGIAMAGIAASASAGAGDNPFALSELGSGYQLAAGEKEAEGKCGEGKCGDTKTDAEGKCGEGKCGDTKTGAEGKCGEGKCGESKGEGS